MVYCALYPAHSLNKQQYKLMVFTCYYYYIMQVKQIKEGSNINIYRYWYILQLAI